MDFVSIRIITDDVARLAGFYERATGGQASWSNENFAELTTSSATLAIASTRTVPLFAPAPPGRLLITTPSSSSSSSMMWTACTGTWPASSRTSSPSPPRCHGVTGRCCSAIPTATSSTSSPPSPRPPSTSSPADDAAADPGTLPGRSRRTARGSARGIALPLTVHGVCCAENCGLAGERYGAGRLASPRDLGLRVLPGRRVPSSSRSSSTGGRPARSIFLRTWPSSLAMKTPPTPVKPVWS